MARHKKFEIHAGKLISKLVKSPINKNNSRDAKFHTFKSSFDKKKAR